VSHRQVKRARVKERREAPWRELWWQLQQEQDKWREENEWRWTDVPDVPDAGSW
jgi:hypothetical protein